MTKSIPIRSSQPLRPHEALRMLRKRQDLQAYLPASLKQNALSRPRLRYVSIRELILISGLDPRQVSEEKANALLAEINEPPFCIQDLGITITRGGSVVVLQDNGFTRALAKTVHESLRTRGIEVLAKSLFRADRKKGRLFRAIEQRLGVRLPTEAEAREVVADQGLTTSDLGFPIQNPSNPERITHFWNYKENRPQRTTRPNNENDLFGRLVVVLVAD